MNKHCRSLDHETLKPSVAPKYLEDENIVKEVMSRIKCSIMSGGFVAMHSHTIKKDDEKQDYDPYFFSDTFSSKLSLNAVIKHVPSLHIIGEKDIRVPPTLSDKLAKKFSKSKSYIHDKGHVIPQDVESCNQIISFLDSYLDILHKSDV